VGIPKPSWQKDQKTTIESKQDKFIKVRPASRFKGGIIRNGRPVTGKPSLKTNKLLTNAQQNKISTDLMNGNNTISSNRRTT